LVCSGALFVAMASPSWLPVQGDRLAFREQGRGPPLVLVHGDVSDARTWDAVLPRFAAGHRVLAYARRGHAPNAPPRAGEGSPLRAHVQDLLAVVEHLGGGPVDVVGNSFGAYTALEFARAHAGKVRALALQEPPLLPLVIGLPPKPEELQALQRSDPRLAAGMGDLLARCVGPAIEAFARGDDRAAVEGFMRYHGAPLLATHPERMQQALDNAGAMKAALLVEHFAPMTEADVRTIQAPTLLLTGSASPAYLQLLSERLAKLLPRAEWQRLRGVGHFAHEEDPAAFAGAVEGFLARV
jgi:pimeloyl-ACP methyl ester carboxylesterase